MTLNRTLFFLIAAIVCFVVALLLALAVFSGGNQQAWEIGGFLALALSFVP
jgi:hypothetical protein